MNCSVNRVDLYGNLLNASLERRGEGRREENGGREERETTEIGSSQDV